MAYHSPFDLYYYFVNVFAGSIEIFLALSFIVIASVSAMFRMPTLVTGIFFALFIIMLTVITETWYILVLAIIAIIIGWSVTRYFK